MEYFKTSQSVYKFKVFGLAGLALALIFGSLFIFKKAPGVASTAYFESLKISPSSLKGNTIWGSGETFDTVVAAGGLDAWAAFYSATQKSSGGLDPSGYLSIDGVPYNFTWTGASAFDGNDAIRLTSAYSSSRISLDTIGAYEKLYVLGTAGGPGEGNYANFAVRVNYTDGTTDETSYRLYDWYDPTPVAGVYKYPNLARRQVVKSSSGRNSSSDYIYEGSVSGAPYLQSATISVDAKKLVSSVDLVLTGKNGSSDTSGIYCGIYAVTGMVNVSAPNPVETISVSNVSETTADISWNSVPNATSYRLDIALDPDFKNILPTYNNLFVRDISLTATGLNGDTTYYTRVRAENDEGQSISSDVAPFTTLNETVPPVVSLDGRPNLIQILDLLGISATDVSGVKNIEESLDGGTTWSVISETDSTSLEITENGLYCFRATDIYDNVSEPSCLTYAYLDTQKPVIVVDTNGYSVGTWTNQPITLTVHSLTSNVGETKYFYSTDSGATWQDYSDAVVFNGETPESGTTFLFKARSEAGAESDIVSVLLKKDSTAPTGEITGEEQSYNSFLNSITFGLFFNRTVDFSITPEDALSGIASTEYLVVKTPFESKESALASADWRPVDGPVSIQPEKDFILYYKLTDLAGNVAVLNTEGVILDTTDALIRGYVSADNTYPLEDGKTYYLTQKILITDNKALSTVTINGEPIDLPASGILELRGNSDNTYLIVATDKAGNVTSVTVHTSALSNLALGITEDNYKTDDKALLENTISSLSTLSETEGANATEDEQTVLSNLAELYTDLIEKIDNLESELLAEHAATDAVPDLDHVTSADRDQIVTTLEAIQETQDTSGVHLTVPEQNELLEDKRELEEKLARLNEVSEIQESLEIVYLTDEEVIKTNDKAELNDLLESAESLLVGTNETPEEKTQTEEEKTIIETLLSRIEEALAAENTEHILQAEQILPDSYSKDDKALLTSAESDIVSAISGYNSNYTEAEQTRLDNLLSEIHSALADIEEQEQEEIRRTTFPTLELSGQTATWTPSDDLKITAGDVYGLSDVSFSSDNGLTWTSLGATTSSEQIILANGTYLVRATNLFDNTTEKAITYSNIDGVTPVLSLDSHGYALGSWTNLPISLSVANVAPNLSPVQLYVRTDDGDWTNYSEGEIIVSSEDTSGTVYEFYAKSAAGLTSEPIQAVLRKDAVAPTGLVASGENSWNSLLNSLTFGLFFNDTASFTLSAEDDRSGLASAWYYVSDTELSPEALASATWLPAASSVSVDPERDFSVYYRLLDLAGNVTILNTDGVVLDVTPPVIMGYVNGETYPLSPDQTYYLSQKLLITDNKALSEITLNGAPVALNSSNLLDLPGNINAVHELRVTDKAGNITVLNLKTSTIPELTDLEHKTIADSADLDEAIHNLHDLAGENPSDSERTLIEHLIENYQTTQDEITDTEEKVGRVEYEALTLSDPDHITTANKDKILELLDDIEDIFEHNFNHLTEAEKSDLAHLKDDLENKLKQILDYEAEKERIADAVDSYSPSTVTSDDRADLETLKDDTQTLRDDSHSSSDDKADLTAIIQEIDNLLDQIKAAEEALKQAEANDTVPDVTPENVTPEDQTALENAQTGYAEALGVFDSNLSPSDLLGATNRIAIIGSSLDILDQVAEFESLISRLPNPEDVDYAARSVIRAAEAAYNALSEYARTLVGPSLLSKYRAVIEAYRAYLAGSPILYAFETLDVFWWGITSFFIAASFLFVVSRTHRRYAEADSDKF